MVVSRLVPVFLVLALAGCDQFRANERAALAVVISPCPISAVLADAVSITKLRPGTPPSTNPDPSTVAFTAEMDKPVLTCLYDPKKNTLSVDAAFKIQATRGPASAGDPPLDFFVAIVDVDNNVLFKKIYQYQPNLGSSQAGQWTQKINGLAVPMEADRRPTDYEILTGFQLTPAELAFNRIPKTAPQPHP